MPQYLRAKILRRHNAPAVNLLNAVFVFLLLTTYYLLLTIPAHASEQVSAGVANQPIWFSKEPFFAGEKITVFTLIYNSSAYKMTGTIELRDSTTTVDTKAFVVNGDGAAKVIGFVWVATEGTHTFRVVISSKQFFDDAGNEHAGAIAAATSTTETKRYVDLDTDGDMIGNLVDDDDDGDGLLDVVEIKLKLDPLNPDTDGDGIMDGEDKEPLKPAPPPMPTPPASAEPPASSILPSVAEKLNENLPEPVASRAIPVVGAVENFRAGQAEKYLDWVGKIQDELAARMATTTGEEGGQKESGWKTFATGVVSPHVFTDPFGYLRLFFALVLRFLVSNPYVFYILLLLISYQLIRSILKFFF
jgi:hypothetical protein